MDKTLESKVEFSPELGWYDENRQWHVSNDFEACVDGNAAYWIAADDMAVINRYRNNEPKLRGDALVLQILIDQYVDKATGLLRSYEFDRAEPAMIFARYLWNLM